MIMPHGGDNREHRRPDDGLNPIEAAEQLRLDWDVADDRSYPEGLDLPDGVADLTERRRRRLLAALGLAPTVPSPCGPCCRCYGRPMGSGCGS
jgi:hypothetical protein